MSHTSFHRLAVVAVLYLLAISLDPYAAAEERDNFDDADAIIAVDNFTYDIDKPTKANYTVYRLIEIRNDDGREYGLLVIPVSKYINLKEFTATVLDADGHVVAKKRKDDLEKICGFHEYALYTDVCHWGIYLSHIFYPYYIEYSYTIEHKSIFFWPPWKAYEDIPIISSSYTLFCPEDIPYGTEMVGKFVPGDSLVEIDGHMARRFTRDSIPPLVSHRCGIIDSASVGNIRFFPERLKLDKYEFNADSWNSLSRGSYRMFADAFSIGKTSLALAMSGTQSQYAEKLHEQLIKRLRYVAIEIGVGNWQPSKAQETFDLGYGDCKDLSSLYAALLRQDGIEAIPTPILTRDEGFIDADFPSISRFNHVILFSILDGDTVWIDPTCQTCPVGDLPWTDENVNVLVIDSAGSGLVRTPASTPAENVLHRTTRVNINQDKSISVGLRIWADGNIRHRMHSLLTYADPDKIGHVLRENFKWVSPRFATDSMACKGVLADDSSCPVIELWGRIGNAIHVIRDKVYVQLDIAPFLSECEDYLLSDSDLITFTAGYPHAWSDSLIIALPEGMTPSDLSADTILQTDVGSLEMTFAQDGDNFIIHRYRTVSFYTAHDEQVAAYRELVGSANQLNPSRLILTSGESSGK